MREREKIHTKDVGRLAWGSRNLDNVNLSSRSSPNFLNHFTLTYKHLLLCLLASGRTLTFPLPPSFRTAAAKAQDFLSSKNLPSQVHSSSPSVTSTFPSLSPLPPNPLLTLVTLLSALIFPTILPTLPSGLST